MLLYAQNYKIKQIKNEDTWAHLRFYTGMGSTHSAPQGTPAPDPDWTTAACTWSFSSSSSSSLDEQ